MKKFFSFTNLSSYDKKIKEYINTVFDQATGDSYPIDKIYPIGSIYISVNNISPGAAFGGEWERIEDVFLLSAGGSYNAGDVGGEAEHILTEEELPSHVHSLKTDLKGDTIWPSYTSYVGGWSQYPFSEKTLSGETTSVGGNAAHNNMPPYLVVYMWKRVK